MESSILSAVSEAMKEDDIRSRVLNMLDQPEPPNISQASVLHDEVPSTSGPSGSMISEKEKSDQLKLALEMESRLHPVSNMYEPSFDPRPLPLEVRDTTPGEACAAYPILLRNFYGDRALSVEGIRCSLQYIARCFEADQSANPISDMRLSACFKSTRSLTAYEDIRACIFFETNLEFRLLRLLLTAWGNQAPLFAGFSSDAKKRRMMVFWLMQFFDANSKRQPFLTTRHRVCKHRTWMLQVMEKLSAEPGPITPGLMTQLMLNELEKKYDWGKLCKTTHADPDDWIPNVTTYSLNKAGRGAARLLRLLARCPLNLLSDEELSSCLQSLETAYADPVDVCERWWYKMVLRTPHDASSGYHGDVRHWFAIGPSDRQFGKSFTNYTTARREGFWARVSWLFQHKFASVANRVKTVWSLPHERQNAMDVLDIAAALNACVAEAYTELSYNVRLRGGIQFASVYDLVPAITLLKTHKATLPTNPRGSEGNLSIASNPPPQSDPVHHSLIP
eukprot:Blabericola_migrator_1__1248@NODE_1320_length_4810_cov_10_018343_g889_i0_p1_GENE_NODE_1320_length_4810_cov_10_018343_g889_i0NODE_1320_length_4810_cov_10_018343_g889_i0_p1_ORF_typecomplete_len593_score77_47_NODE_1320_length_4810_cov_10_018343_g889_i030314548